MNLKYKDEIIKSVSLYEETIKPRPILSIVHPYVLRCFSAAKEFR